MASTKLFSAVEPEETIRARKSALDSFTNLVPAEKKQQRYEQQNLQQQVADATLRQPNKAEGGGTQSVGAMGLGALGILGKGTAAAAKQYGEQGQRMDQLNLAGAKQQQSMADSKTKQAVTNTVRGMENETQKLARMVADRAFQEGMSVKELLFSKNNALADYAFEVARDDFQKGRLSEKEIRDLTNTFALEAEKKKNKADQYLKELEGEFSTNLTGHNIERLKSRMLATLAAQKEALEAAAKAQATSQIASGIIGAVAAVAGEDSVWGKILERLSNTVGGKK
jgi:hypothetical protein